MIVLAEGYSVHNVSGGSFAYRQAMNTRADTLNSIQKLSSGFRVNRAADDAAGLAVSERMRAQVAGAKMAMRNAQDAKSFAQTAEATLNEAHSILQRMRELMIQGANGIYTETDRMHIQLEVDELKKQLDLNAAGGKINGHIIGAVEDDAAGAHIDDFRFGEFDVNVHYNDDGAGGQFDVNADGTNDFTQAELQEFHERMVLQVKHALQQAYGRTGWGNPADGANFGNSIDVVIQENNAAMGSTALASANATTVNINLTAFQNNMTDPNADVDIFSAEQVLAHEATHVLQRREAVREATTPGWVIEGSAEYGGNAGDARSEGTGAGILNGLLTPDDVNNWAAAATSNDYAEAYQAQRYIVETYGAKVLGDFYRNMEDTGASSSTEVESALLRAIRPKDPTLTSFTQFETRYQAWFTANGPKSGLTTGDMGRTSLEPLVNEKIDMHLGANSGQTVNLDTFLMTAGAIDMVSFANVTTREMANRSIDVIDRAMLLVNRARARTAAIANRIDHAFNSMGIYRESASAGESKIRDTDMAREMIDLTRSQIMQNSSQAILAQVNARHANVLNLVA